MKKRTKKLYSLASWLHVAGRLGEAEQNYREVLALSPDHADAQHGLGVLAHDMGRSDLAIAHIGRALKLKPRQSHYHINLGRALRTLGHTEEARAAFHVAVLLAPEDPIAHFNLATALTDLGRIEEAVASYRTALRLDPFFVEACSNLGLLQHQAGDLAEAESSFRHLRSLRPDDAEAHGVWAVVLRQLGRVAESEAPLREATRLDPQNAEWLNLLGATLIDLRRDEEAEAPLRAALRRNPDHVDAHNNLGLALLAIGRPGDAQAALVEALRRQPGNADIRNNLGTALRALGHSEAAENCFRAALAGDPQHAASHFNLATTLLAKGDFAAGWAEFEWRDRAPGGRRRDFAAPRWTGAPLGEGTVLIHAEQGFGDTIQFARYLALASRRARILLEVPTPLLRLFDGLEGVAQIVVRGAELPPFDAHCPLLSLPAVLGTADTIPAVPYLRAPPSEVWRSRLAGLSGWRVGLCWAGSRAYAQDRWRSLAAADLIGLAAVPGVALVSLQKESAGPVPPGLSLHDWTGEMADFADTAALLAQLDLVISVDTAIAHLAGALGRPVWLLNRFDADWRWQRGRDDSPWYPTLRQFRQPSPGDWAPVVTQVAAALAAETS